MGDTETKVNLAVIHALQKETRDDVKEIKQGVAETRKTLVDHEGRISSLETWAKYVLGVGFVIAVAAVVVKVLTGA